MGVIPEELREPIRAQLQRLVVGDLPDLLVWVNDYGKSGATLVDQPDDVWSHPDSEAIATPDGSWHVILPLWTTEESPSDLSADLAIDRDLIVTILDVHVL